MPITVGELLEMPYLRLTLHSGESGLDRTVSWTHTTDLPEPWRWVAGGELLMTNGMSFPKSAAAQEDLVRQLVEHGATALAIGSDMYCPPLSRRLAKVSDELAFPVLWIAYPMPFVSISRTVAEATLLEQSQRLIRTERIYRALQRVSADKDGLRALTDSLSRELACSVLICERGSGGLWTGDNGPDAAVRDAVSGGQGRLRAGVMAAHLDDGRRVLTISVPTHDDALMVCEPRPDHEPDAILLQHAATVCALGLSQARLTIEQQRRASAELLVQILEGHFSPTSVEQQLVERQLQPQALVVIAAQGEDPDRMRELHVRLWRTDTAHLTVHRSGLAVSLLCEDTVERYLDAVGDDARIGISLPVVRPSRIADAEREARWALEIAASHGGGVVRYAEAIPELGPRTPDEAKAFVRRILQPVLDRPDTESAELLETLLLFLENGRSWQRTAEATHLHRQTVLYRIRKVERLTGLDVSDTADLATLWVALTTLRRLRGGRGR